MEKLVAAAQFKARKMLDPMKAIKRLDAARSGSKEPDAPPSVLGQFIALVERFKKDLPQYAEELSPFLVVLQKLLRSFAGDEESALTEEEITAAREVLEEHFTELEEVLYALSLRARGEEAVL